VLLRRVAVTVSYEKGHKSWRTSLRWSDSSERNSCWSKLGLRRNSLVSPSLFEDSDNLHFHRTDACSTSMSFPGMAPSSGGGGMSEQEQAIVKTVCGDTVDLGRVD